MYVPSNVVHSGKATADPDVVFFTVKDASHSLHGIKATIVSRWPKATEEKSIMIRYRRYAVMAALIVCAAVTALAAALAAELAIAADPRLSPVQRR